MPASDASRVRPPCRRRAAALASGAAAIALACGGGADPRPDLLLITVDTLRPDRLACYGGAADVGRAICGLGREGTRYVWAFATAAATAPSVASILTSRHPRAHGVREPAATRLDDEVETVAERLSRAGYTTAAFVSNPVLHPARRFGRGFEVYDYRMTRRERNRPEAREREAAAATDAALAWARVAERPWLLWIHYQDPHGPYEPPGATPARDMPGGPRLPVLDDHSGWRGIPAYQALPGAFTPGAYERRYQDEIRYLDGEIERLLSALDARAARPLVVLTADHGEAFGEDDYYFAHGHSLGLDQIRVPLLLRPVAPAEAAVVHTPVATLDVAPTLLAAAGAEIPASLRGAPLPRDQPEAAAREARALFAEHRHRIAIVAGDTYYARDLRALRDLGGRVRDRISGGVVRPLPPRLARLARDGRMPAYEPVSGKGAAALERLADAFASGAGAARPEPAGAEPVELDAATRDALRALGYLE